MKYIVKKIQEADFGCEERPEGYTPQVINRLRDEAGQEIEMEVADADLYAKDINEDLLFISSKGRPLCTQIVTDAIDRIIKEINLCRDMSEQMPKFSPHCFRHTFATRCFEAGIPPKTVQVLLGHSSLDMAMNLYTHVMPEQKIDALEKLNSYYSDINNDMNKEIVIDESIFISAE